MGEVGRVLPRSGSAAQVLLEPRAASVANVCCDAGRKKRRGTYSLQPKLQRPDGHLFLEHLALCPSLALTQAIRETGDNWLDLLPQLFWMAASAPICAAVSEMRSNS